MGKKKYVKPIWKYDPKVDTPTNNTKFVQLYHSQMTHRKFLKLSSTSKIVYIYMLDYSNGSMTTEFPKSIYSTFTTTPTFLKAIDELCEKGFIEVIESGRFTRTKNIYKFISKWSE